MKALKLLLASTLLGGLLLYGEGSPAATAGITRTNSEGGVTFKVTLFQFEDDEIRFDIVLNTHSVNLDAYDLKASTLLHDDTGKTYEPSRAENKGSGHHREVTLVFPRSASQVKRLELVIKDIAGIKERNFLWDLDDKKK